MPRHDDEVHGNTRSGLSHKPLRVAGKIVRATSASNQLPFERPVQICVVCANLQVQRLDSLLAAQMLIVTSIQVLMYGTVMCAWQPTVPSATVTAIANIDSKYCKQGLGTVSLWCKHFRERCTRPM